MREVHLLYDADGDLVEESVHFEYLEGQAREGWFIETFALPAQAHNTTRF